MMWIFIQLPILALLAETDNPTWWADKIWWAIGIIVLVGFSTIILLSKKREDVQLTESKRADALDKLLKTRDVELADLQRRYDDKFEDYETLSAEYKTLAGIAIKDLFNFFEQKESILAELADAKADIRIYEKRKGSNK